MSNRILLGATMLPMAALLFGCGGRAEVVLRQPFAPPSQRELTLSSDWAFTATNGGWRECVMEFPLPGARTGPRDFHLYVSFPDVDQPTPVVADAANAVRGFLIQEVGQLAGKTELSGGTVWCRKVLLRPRQRRLELQLECTDGTQITGTALVEASGREVRAFQREFARDIQALEEGAAVEESPGAETAPRRPPAP